MAVLRDARGGGVRRIAILGISGLAEIAGICALDRGIAILLQSIRSLNCLPLSACPIKADFDDVGGEVDAVVVTDMKDAFAAIEAATSRFGAERVLVPAMLDVRGSRKGGTA
jgi:hypothetical protein